MAQYELNFRDYWRIIRRRRWSILITFVVVAGGAVYYNNSQTPVYQASAQVRVERPKSLASSLMDSLATSYYENPMVTEAQVIQSRPVAEEVVRSLGLADPNDPERFQQAVSDVQNSLFAEPMRTTSILRITVTASDPDRAYQVANAAATAYVEQNLRQKNRQARKVREFIETQLVDTERRLREAENQMRALRERGASGLALALDAQLIELQKERSALLTKATPLHPDAVRLQQQIEELQQQLRELPREEVDLARIEREVDVSAKTYTTLRQKLEEARIAEAEKIEDVRIVNPAIRPRAPVRPNRQLGYTIGALLGLMLGLVTAFLWENMDTSLGTIEDVEELLHTPVLGVLQHIRVAQAEGESAAGERSWWRKLSRMRSAVNPDPMLTDLFVHFHPKAPEAEAFRTLRTNLKVSEQRKLFMITSSGPREGKTTIVSNLGVVIGQAGSRVLLIASDLRKPMLPKSFGIRRDPGLVEVLSGTIPVEKAIRGFADFAMGKLGFSRAMQTPGLDNVFLLPSGHIPSNPSELVSSKEMKALLEHLRPQYDVIILDAPPVLPIADAMQIAPLVDGVILVYEVGRTARAALLRTKSQLESSDGKIIGVILNHVRPETQYPAYYYYRYRYYERGQGEDAAERPKAGA